MEISKVVFKKDYSNKVDFSDEVLVANIEVSMNHQGYDVDLVIVDSSGKVRFTDIDSVARELSEYAENQTEIASSKIYDAIEIDQDEMDRAIAEYLENLEI